MALKNECCDKKIHLEIDQNSESDFSKDEADDGEGEGCEEALARYEAPTAGQEGDRQGDKTCCQQEIRHQ